MFANTKFSESHHADNSKIFLLVYEGGTLSVLSPLSVFCFEESPGSRVKQDVFLYKNVILPLLGGNYA